ncbi:MAG: VOC family protein [Bacteroidota bacterium]
MNLNQVTLPARDLSLSVTFYRRLGLRLIVDAPPHYARFECPEGDSTFSLHRTDTPVGGEGPAIYFECKDLDERVERLAAEGVEFDLLPTDQSWRWREARLRDPDGNRLILFWAGEDRKNPPWRITGQGVDN